jgi:hypothetical protein
MLHYNDHGGRIFLFRMFEFSVRASFAETTKSASDQTAIGCRTPAIQFDPILIGHTRRRKFQARKVACTQLPTRRTSIPKQSIPV